MELINGYRDKVEADKKKRREARKERLRFIMLESYDPAKVFHAAVRWYALREKWETPAKAEFMIYNSMIQLLAQEFSPEWIAREFPAVKEYKGHEWGAKDYYSAMETLAGAEPFAGDEEKANMFLWEWFNYPLMLFVVAGMTIMDELREAQGQLSLMAEFAGDMGIPVYHSVNVGGGKEIMVDDKGRSLGVVHRRRGKHLKTVK